MTAIANVAVTVTLDNGDVVTLNVASPAPLGGNPRFLATQLRTALDMLERRHHDVLEATYGAQQFRPARVSDDVTHWPGERPARELDDVDMARLAIEGAAPPNGIRVRFPDLHGDNVFRVVDREHGIYEVVVPRGLPFKERHQINTDVPSARWEPVE